MDHATIFTRHVSRHQRPLLAVLLGALACGDAGGQSQGMFA